MKIKDTESLCFRCDKRLKAEIVEEENTVYLKRQCIEHGENKTLLSTDARYYRDLMRFYDALIHKRIKQSRYILLLTDKCNMECPICFYDDKNIAAMAVSDIDKIKKLLPDSELILFGREPTCKTDLPEIIKTLRKYQRNISLYTNGVLILADGYLDILIKSGVTKIYLQFDGFVDDCYKDFRNEDLASQKRLILDKLRKKSMPTVLNMTIMRGINDIYIKDLVEYAANNTFIKGFNLIAYAHTGRGKDNFVEKSIMPDEVVDLLESQTQGLVTKRNVYLFQKLVYVYKLISGQRHCPYLQYFWLVRQKSGYASIDKYLNLESLGKVFDRYLDIYKSNRIASGVYLFFVLPRYLLSYKTLCLVGDFLAVIIADLFKKSYLNSPENRLFQLVFNTACDCYNADFTIAANCHVGVVYKNQDDKLEILENDGLYLLRH